jgi:predicted nucleic acid-binding protein
MVVLDTSVFLYLANGTLDQTIVADTDIAHASISKIEALGFPTIPANELLLLDALLEESYSLALTDNIIERAIRLRQIKRMSLGDAIIAATALEHNLVLWTANTRDFQHIEGLRLVNPLGKD